MNRLLYVLSLFTLSLFACRKNDLGGGSDPHPDPVKTEKGIAIGAPTTKIIGSGGGEVTSADGQVKIIVPAGAVTANTLFSIQPITNTLGESTSLHNAYRFLPEGNSFQKPIAVQFQYNELDFKGGPEDLLTVLYQKEDGSWRQVPSSLNKAAKTLTIKTVHFSDWMVWTAFRLNALGPENVHKSSLFAGESVRMKVAGIYHADSLLGDYYAQNVGPWHGRISSIGDWRLLQGPGSLQAVSDGGAAPVIHTMEYKAPASVSDITKVEIAVTVKGNISVPDSSAPGRKRVMREFQFVKELTIVPSHFMTGTFGGRGINYTNVQYSSGQGFAITGRSGTEEISITIDAPPGTGAFPSGDIVFEDGKSKTVLSFPGGPFGSMTYFSEYTTCDPAMPIRYSGLVRIDKFGGIGEQVTGLFQGTLYRMLPGSGGGCPQFEAVPLSIRFGTIRTM